MGVPAKAKEKLCSKIWTIADAIGWSGLTISQRSQYYKNWAEADDIGGELAKYMSVERVHPYIKDSIMKPYAKKQTLTDDVVLNCAGFSIGEVAIIERKIKPFTLLLSSNDMIAWGRAVDWKIVLLSLYERTFNTEYSPTCAILTQSYGKFSESGFTNLVKGSAEKLLISKVVFDK